MSVSIDTSKIETLKKFEETLELLQNPERYTQLLGEVKTALLKLDAATKKYATIEAAEAYLGDAHKAVSRAKEEAKKIEVEMEKRQSELETYIQTRMAEVNESAAAAHRAQQEAYDMVKKAREMEAKVKREKEIFEEKRADDLKKIEIRDAESRRKAREFNDKLDAMKKLAG